MIDGIIFDVDGTLLDSMEMWKNLDYEFLESVNVIPDSDYTETVNKMTLSEGVRYTKDRYRLTLTEDEIMDRIQSMAADFYYHRAELKPYVKGFLAKLFERNIPMAIATSSRKEFISHALERNGIAHYFREIYSGSDLNINKTKPDLFLMAAEAVGGDPENIWVFEDSYHAVMTAKNAGFPVVSVFDRSNENFLKETIQNSNLYMEDLRDFDRFLSFAAPQRS